MRLNNKGMAISGILYSILVLFIVLVFGILSLLASTKFSFDKFRSDIKEKLENTNFAYANEDYMLLSGADLSNEYMSIFRILYENKFSLIKSVNFITSNTIPENAIDIKDVSKTGMGKVKSYLLGNDEDGYELNIVSNSPIYANYNSSYLLANLSAVTTVNFSNFDTSVTNNLNCFFYNMRSLENIDVSHFDTSNVTTIIEMFRDCDSLIDIDLSNWDTSNLIQARSVFVYCDILKTVNLSGWDVSNVKNFAWMFAHLFNIETIIVDNNWNLANCETIQGLFLQCYKLNNLDLSNWDVSNVSAFTDVFNGCKSLSSLDISN